MEYEYKWAARGPEDFKIFLAALGARKRPQVKKIRDVYFDSADKYYSKNKISCRLRRENGKFILTLKGAAVIKNGLAARPEQNFALKSKTFPAAQKEMLEFLPDKKIKKVFTISNKRTVYKTGKNFEAEADLDDFTINSGGKKRKMFEIEMEFKKGRKNIFKTSAQKISRRTKLKFAKISKVKTALSMLKK